MTDSRAAAGIDRLPWLADEPARKPAPARRGGLEFIGWAAAAVLLVAGASFWLGTRTEAPEASQAGRPPVTTVPLPQPRAAPSQEVTIAPQPEVRPVPAPEVRQAPTPEVHFAAPPSRKAIPQEAEKAAESEQSAASETLTQENKTSAPAAAAAPAARAPVARPAPLRPWQPRVVAGAAGRLVEVGAFGSVTQAKLGWRYMVRTYPAVARLPAVVRPDRNSRGRVFYRFRVGTTSQAHSEVLCQRMQKIHLSCAVVGLPWKAKVER
jgi:outer membrane biosynthesis protein TonB